MKNVIRIIVLLFYTTLYSQKNEREEIYLLFDETSDKKCTIDHKGDDDYSDRYEVIKYYKKYYDKEEGEIEFYFCDRSFEVELKYSSYPPKRISINQNRLKLYNIKEVSCLDSIRNHYKLNIIRKISKQRAIIYYDADETYYEE